MPCDQLHRRHINTPFPSNFYSTSPTSFPTPLAVFLVIYPIHSIIMLTTTFAPSTAAQQDQCEPETSRANAFGRPHIQDQADFDVLVSVCRGSSDDLDRMPYVADHLDFLAEREDMYIAQADSSSGAGDPPVFLYHTYWKGPMTWRIELFIKSFLQTQNLALSRLHIWVDEDSADSPTAKAMLDHALFKQFQPLLDKQSIVVHPWTLPKKIAIRSDLDHRDGRDYFRRPWPRLGSGVTMVADSVFRDDSTGQLWLDFFVEPSTCVAPVAMSDVFRFVILHQHGGIYIDMDVILMRDLRPLLTPNQPFAERWGCHDGQGDYNTAVLFLGDAGSDLATYFLRIGTRLGHQFHPRTMGDIARRDGRHRELHMLETAAFDPVWCEFSGKRKGKTTSPDFVVFEEFFKARTQDEKTFLPSNTQTLSQLVGTGFFKGAFGYHIHNLVSAVVELATLQAPMQVFLALDETGQLANLCQHCSGKQYLSADPGYGKSLSGKTVTLGGKRQTFMERCGMG